MHEEHVRLGNGIIKNTSISNTENMPNEDFFWNELKKLGIEKHELDSINPTYDDLLEIYSDLKNSGFSVRYFLDK